MPGRSNVSRAVDGLAAALKDAGSPERAVHEQAYLKWDREHYGVSVPRMRQITLELLRTDATFAGADARAGVVAFVTEAWDRGPHELRLAAVEVLRARAHLLVKTDIDLVERLLRESHTWALVDGIAPVVAWDLLDRYPTLQARIDAWGVDPDFWLRRSALLTYLQPMRRGEPVFERFASLAEPLLGDIEFFVRKAIGWVLRERTKLRPDEVFEWLLPRAHSMSGLTLREAGKHLGAERRATLSAAHSV